MIKTDVSFGDFWDWLQSSSGYKNNFSYEGARALFDYLESLSDEIGEDVDYDPVAWCVEYSEYGSFKELKDNYTDIKNMEDLSNHTTVVSESPLVIQDF